MQNDITAKTNVNIIFGIPALTTDCDKATLATLLTNMQNALVELVNATNTAKHKVCGTVLGMADVDVAIPTYTRLLDEIRSGRINPNTFQTYMQHFGEYFGTTGRITETMGTVTYHHSSITAETWTKLETAFVAFQTAFTTFWNTLKNKALKIGKRKVDITDLNMVTSYFNTMMTALKARQIDLFLTTMGMYFLALRNYAYSTRTEILAIQETVCTVVETTPVDTTK